MKITPSWTESHMVVTLLMRGKNGDSELLLGPKKTGPIQGYLSAVGGKIEPCDRNRIATSRRECLEESGYRHGKVSLAAIVKVSIAEERKKFTIHIFSSSQFTGRLQVEERSFEWLKFIPLSEIPWDQFAPGEEGWMKRVLFNKERLRVYIRCGRDRKDLLGVRCIRM